MRDALARIPVRAAFGLACAFGCAGSAWSGAPTVAVGPGVQASGGVVVFGAEPENVVAVDAESGEERWQSDAADYPLATNRRWVAAQAVREETGLSVVVLALATGEAHHTCGLLPTVVPGTIVGAAASAWFEGDVLHLRWRGPSGSGSARCDADGQIVEEPDWPNPELARRDAAYHWRPPSTWPFGEVADEGGRTALLVDDDARDAVALLAPLTNTPRWSVPYAATQGFTRGCVVGEEAWVIGADHRTVTRLAVGTGAVLGTGAAGAGTCAGAWWGGGFVGIAQEGDLVGWDSAGKERWRRALRRIPVAPDPPALP